VPGPQIGTVPTDEGSCLVGERGEEEREQGEKVVQSLEHQCQNGNKILKWNKFHLTSPSCEIRLFQIRHYWPGVCRTE
jgi:uncharacterized protein YheU (UPF0270 family)